MVRGGEGEGEGEGYVPVKMRPFRKTRLHPPRVWDWDWDWDWAPFSKLITTLKKLKGEEDRVE